MFWSNGIGHFNLERLHTNNGDMSPANFEKSKVRVSTLS